MKHFFAFFFLIGCMGFSQQERETVRGTIMGTSGNPQQGIVIYNEATENGTVSNEEGSFRISVATGDVLTVRALQYKPFKLNVTSEIVESGETLITLEEGVIELDDILITDLTGRLTIDVERIDTFESPLSEIDQKSLVTPKRKNTDSMLSSEPVPADAYPIRNNAMRENTPKVYSQGDLLGLASLLIGTILPSRDKPDLKTIPRKERKEEFSVSMVENKYSADYLVSYLEIPKEDLYDFLYYASDRGLDREMLKQENELELLQFLSEQADVFKKRQK